MALDAQDKIDTNNEFKVWDYLVFAIVLAISASIGVVYGCIRSRQKSTEEFFMAGREMTVRGYTIDLRKIIKNIYSI